MNERTDNVRPFKTAQGTGGNGSGGGDTRERLARLEEKVEHLATKEDIQKIKVWILLGIIGALPISVTMVLLVAKFFVN